MNERGRLRRGRTGRMWCLSCRQEYEELKREIEDLKSKVSSLRLNFPPDSSSADVLLHAAGDSPSAGAPAVPAHRAVLMSRSPVFRAMLDNEMDESRSGKIEICDVSYDVLHSFVRYLYTAEALLDEQMAHELLVMAEKYQVMHLKAFCEKFLTSKVNIDKASAHRHNDKQLLDAALYLIMDNVATLTESEAYKELVEKDPRLVVEIYEACLARQVNTAAKD